MQVAHTIIIRRALGLPYITNADILRNTNSPDTLELVRERRYAAVQSLLAHYDNIKRRGLLIENFTQDDGV